MMEKWRFEKENIAGTFHTLLGDEKKEEEEGKRLQSEQSMAENFIRKKWDSLATYFAYFIST